MTDLFENYTSPWLTDELVLLRDAAAKFFSTELAPQNERWVEQGQADREGVDQDWRGGIFVRRNATAIRWWRRRLSA